MQGKPRRDRRLARIGRVVVCALGLAAATGRSLRAADPVPDKPLSDKECRNWANQVQAAVTRRSVDGFNALVDWDALAAAATALPNSPSDLDALRADFKRDFQATATSKTAGVAQSIIAGVKAGGSYRLLRLHTVDGGKRALFRVISPTGAVNYLDYLLARSKGGLPLAADWRIFNLGEMFSLSARRKFLPLAAKTSQSVLAALPPAERDFVTHVSDYEALVNSARDKRFAEVLEIYKRLPPSVAREKTPFVLRLTAARSIGLAPYLSAMEDFRQEYPGDALVDMHSIDGYVERKAFDKALECVDRIDRAVGPDAFLKVIRATLLAQKGRISAARTMAQRAIAQEPTLPNAYYCLLDLSLKMREFKETARLLSAMETRLHIRFDDLARSPDFAEFVKSPEYNIWLASRNKKK